MRLLVHHPWIAFVVLALMLAEYVWRQASGRGYDLAQSFSSLGVALGQALTRPLNLVVTSALLTWVSRFALWHAPMHDWRVWAVGFVAVEFAYYWFHRWSHTIAWMWATHAVHHTPTQMVLPAAIRLGWTELFSLGWLVFVPLVLLGLPPAMIGALLAIDLAYQFILHTEAPISLGPLEWWLNTPTHHRVHHSRNPQFLDCNFGGMVIVFDRLFGTFRAAAPDTVLDYGLVHGLGSNNVVRIGLGSWADLLTSLRHAPDWRTRLTLALGRPR